VARAARGAAVGYADGLALATGIGTAVARAGAGEATGAGTPEADAVGEATGIGVLVAGTGVADALPGAEGTGAGVAAVARAATGRAVVCWCAVVVAAAALHPATAATHARPAIIEAPVSGQFLLEPM
jgi:hypothetical protein